MTRVRIEYFDQNEGFASCLPKCGHIAKKLSSSTGVDDWYLVELDEPINYQLKIKEPLGFKLVETSWLLIRSRWQGHSIGSSEPTSVFLLLVEPSQLPLSQTLRIEDYHHVAWGMCHTEQVAAQQTVPADGLALRARG